MAGCPAHITPPTTTPPTGSGNAVANTGLVSAPPLATPGERMNYRIQLQGVVLATYEFSVGDFADVDGVKAIVVQSHAKAVGLVQIIAKIDDFFTSWVDIKTGRPLRWVSDEFGTKSSDKERTDVHFTQRAGDMLPIDFHLNDDKPTPEPQKLSLPDVWDYNSFLIALRRWDAPVGTKLTAEVLRSRYVWHVEMTVHGKDQLHTDLGDLPALRLDGHLYKLGRDDARFPDSDERDISVWISDDDGRVPLLVTAATDYGDIKVEITDYQPGTGQRLGN